ncbi:lysophospholipid acyltransferase family protein [Geobacter sp. SVR]|uniref:lysophospholipid acyltransferase family protein n=1 Tax=Geobacter sp. SVR TaxID=2495594 RepID=UPI00143EFC38|nr:lysophospholipid acyltransferase family protein [Geobacter sp. SVR]BCS52427.1 lipid A biosynthesis acyltransferase [Geobacter sp. SVR]GCF87342.1 lipid A biosynthesis acyltransferase [Geobacter sp. SVR]
MKRLFWAVQAALFYVLTLLAAMLPAPVANRLGSSVGMFLMLLLPKRKAIAVDNISRALPFMKSHPLWTSGERTAGELVKETFRNLGRSLVEVCRLYHGRGEDILGRIELRGAEHFEAASARGKGVVFLTGHCGNWELVALAFWRFFRGRMSVVARRQNNPYLNRMVEKMRSRYDNNIIYKQGALRGILSVLKKGDNIGLLADQAVFPEEGALIDMLGRKAWASKAPVIIAHKTGAAFLPSFIHREGDRFVITINPPHVFGSDQSEDGIREEVQALSRYVEDFVVSHPTQWYWVHRRWKRAGESTQ